MYKIVKNMKIVKPENRSNIYKGCTLDISEDSEIVELSNYIFQQSAEEAFFHKKSFVEWDTFRDSYKVTEYSLEEYVPESNSFKTIGLSELVLR